MINQESLQAVHSAQFNARFVKPLYDSYCFSQIPQTVRYLLGDEDNSGLPTNTLGHLVEKYDKVVLVFVDAFGWRFFEQRSETYPFLKRIMAEGVVSKLTAQFPSTTAAHVTAIHTGLPVGQSGIYEWFYYEPKLDAMIAPLLFSFAGDHERDTLKRTHIPATTLFPERTLYQDLRRRGVASFVFQDQAYAHSPYTQVVTEGAQVIPYRTLSEALVNLSELLLRQQNKSYYFLYFANIDTICHLYGPNSPHVAAEIDMFLTAMERIFHQNLAGKLNRTLFLMTADHGQVETDPATTIYLNNSLPRIESYIKTNGTGYPLVPGGSCRDMFMYIKHEYVDEAHAYLQKGLEGKAEVYRTEELIDRGFFGSASPSAVFRSRVGDLVILPYKHESVWWYQKDRFEQRYYGHHGGLTREEMETPFLAQAYV